MKFDHHFFVLFHSLILFFLFRIKSLFPRFSCLFAEQMKTGIATLPEISGYYSIKTCCQSIYHINALAWTSSYICFPYKVYIIFHPSSILENYRMVFDKSTLVDEQFWTNVTPFEGSEENCDHR